MTKVPAKSNLKRKRFLWAFGFEGIVHRGREDKVAEAGGSGSPWVHSQEAEMNAVSQLPHSVQSPRP